MTFLGAATCLIALQSAPAVNFADEAIQAKIDLDRTLHQIADDGDFHPSARDAVERSIENSHQVWRVDAEVWMACGPCNSPGTDAGLLSAYIADQTVQRAYFEIAQRSANEGPAFELYGEVRRAIVSANVETASSFLGGLSHPDERAASEADWNILSIIARHSHEHPRFLVEYLAEVAARADQSENRTYDLYYFVDFLSQFQFVSRGQSLGAYVVCQDGEAAFDPALEDPVQTEILRERLGLVPISERLSERSTRC